MLLAIHVFGIGRRRATICARHSLFRCFFSMLFLFLSQATTVHALHLMVSAYFVSFSAESALCSGLTAESKSFGSLIRICFLKSHKTSLIDYSSILLHRVH